MFSCQEHLHGRLKILHRHHERWQTTAYDAMMAVVCAQDRTGSYAGEDFVGDAKLAAGLHHDWGDGRVVRVADVGEEVMHHLQHAYIMRRLHTGPI